MRRAAAFLCLYLPTLVFAQPLLGQAPDSAPPDFVTVKPQGGAVALRWSDAADQLIESLLAGKTLSSGVAGTWQYDSARRPVSAAFTSPLGAVYQESTAWNPRGLKIGQSLGDQNGTGSLLGYDGAGRLVQSAQAPSPLAAASNNSRLDPATLAALPEGAAFTYDAAQNLLARTVRQSGAPKTEEMPLDASGRNRPASVNGKPLEWDANGNLTRKGDLRFQYDDRHRLSKVTNLAGQEQASYAYDAFNRRLQRTVGSEAWETVWSGWQPIEEYKNGALTSRRTYGLDIDEIVQLESDLDNDGTPESAYAPVYDSTGNLVALTGANGKPIERYTYDAYGRQTILVDALPPVVEQVRVKDGALWLETSEEVDTAALAAAITAGHLTLTPAGGAPIALTATQPVQEGLQARRRVVLTPATVPIAGTSVALSIQSDALVDSFLNRPTATFELTFEWPASDTVLQDTVPPRVEQVAVRQGHIEIELSEEPDLAAAASALQVDGQAVTWTLDTDRYTLISVPAYQPGSYSLTLSTATLDLASLGLAEAFQKDVVVHAGLVRSLVSRRADPRQVAVSTVGNPFGFQGLPLDTETGFLYVRNRYYDPEMGRFVSVDPLGYVDGPNPYGFVKNDPVNGRDPLGTCWSESGMAFFQCVARALRGDEDMQAVVREQSKELGENVTKAVAKEAAATAAEELTPAGVVNGLAVAGGYDILRQEEVEGFIPRALGVVSILPGVPSAVRYLDEAGPLVRHVDDIPMPHGQSSLTSFEVQVQRSVPLEDGSFLFRGVHAGHPELASAKQGWAIPGDVNGAVAPEAHNAGRVADSPFTSWTRDPEIAKYHALKEGPGGLILRAPVGAPPSGATWSWIYSPDEFSELEVLLRGIRGELEVFVP